MSDRKYGLYIDGRYIEVTEEVYRDDGYSGTNFEGPGVKRLLSFVKEGKVCCAVS